MMTLKLLATHIENVLGVPAVINAHVADSPVCGIDMSTRLRLSAYQPPGSMEVQVTLERPDGSTTNHELRTPDDAKAWLESLRPEFLAKWRDPIWNWSVVRTAAIGRLTMNRHDPKAVPVTCYLAVPYNVVNTSVYVRQESQSPEVWAWAFGSKAGRLSPRFGTAHEAMLDAENMLGCLRYTWMHEVTRLTAGQNPTYLCGFGPNVTLHVHLDGHWKVGETGPHGQAENILAAMLAAEAAVS